MSDTLRVLKSWRRVRLSIVRETSPGPYEAPRAVQNGGDVADLVRTLLADDPREHFVAVYLDTKHVVMAVHVAHIGTINTCPVVPRDVFLPAVHMAAASLVVAHNHPTGDEMPSPEDLRVTERLRQAGELLGIELLVHLVIGAERYYSIASHSAHPLRQ